MMNEALLGDSNLKGTELSDMKDGSVLKKGDEKV